MTFIPQYGISSLKVLIGTVGGGAITAGSHNLGPVGFTPLPGRLTADYFSPADVGRIITVLGAGASGGILIARITSVTDTQNVVLDTAASTSVGSGVSNVTVFRPLTVQAGSLSYSNSLTDGMEASFVSEQLVSEFPPVAGQPFLLTSTDPSVGDAWGTFAGGEIDSVETNNITGNVGTMSTCHCVSYKAVLQRRTMLGKSYSSTTQQAIAADITAQATTDCIGLVTVSGPAVSLFTVADYTYLDAALDDLIRNINNATDTYFWYVDQWRRVVLANQTTTPAPWSVSDSAHTDGNVRVTVSVASSRDKLANQRYLKATKALGDTQTTVFGNTFNGAPLPFARRALTLPQKAGITPSIVVTSLGAQRVWVCPTDPRNDTGAVTIPVGYDWAWPIDSDYLFCDGSRPGIPTGQSGTVTYRVAFEAISPYLKVSSVNERSAIEGGSGLHEVVESVDVPIIKTELDAMSQASTEASSVPPSSVTVQSFRGGLAAGQGLTVHLTDIGALVNYLVESVSLAEENGWVRWDVKASIGSLVGGYLKALSSAFDPRPSGAGGGVRNITGSVLAVSFAGGTGQVGEAYSSALLAAGGLGPYTYGKASGTLPPGVGIDPATGTLSGTPTTAGTYSFIGNVIDANGTIAQTPTQFIQVVATGGFTALPVATSVGRDVGHSTDSVDPLTRLIYCQVGAVATYASTPDQDGTVYYSEDNGATWEWIGVWTWTASGQEIFFSRIRKQGDKTCKIAIADGKIDGDAAILIPNAALPANAVPSAAFTLAKPSKPAANLITALTATAGVGGFVPYNRTTPDGFQYYSIADFTYDDSPCVLVPSAYFVRITAQDYNAAGTSIGPEQAFSGFLIGKGLVQHCGPLEGEYGNVGYGYTRTGNIYSVRLRVYISNYIDETSIAWQDITNTSTLQTGVGGGLGYLEVMVATGGNAPGGALVGPRVAGLVSNAQTAQSANTMPSSGLTGPINLGNGTLVTYSQVLGPSGNQVAWFGQVGTNYGIYAQNGWFGTGGPGPLGAQIWLDASGNGHFSGSIESGASITAPTINGGSLTITTGGGIVSITTNSNGISITNANRLGFFTGAGISFQSGSLSAVLSATGVYMSGGATYGIGAFSTVIDSNGVFVGAGISCPVYTAWLSSYSAGPSRFLVINASAQFVGAGVSCPSNNVLGFSLSCGAGGVSYNGETGLTTGALAVTVPGGGTGFLRFTAGGLVAKTNL